MSKERYMRVCASLDPAGYPDHPRAYDDLSSGMQALLAYWIAHALKPASHLSRYSTYGMTLHFEHQTEMEVSNAAFKGAMLVAGYLPTDPQLQYWRFPVEKTYDNRQLPRDPYKRREYLHRLPYYRTCLDGSQEIPLQKLIAQARGQGERWIRLLSVSEVFAKSDRRDALLKEAERGREPQT